MQDADEVGRTRLHSVVGGAGAERKAEGLAGEAVGSSALVIYESIHNNIIT